EISLSADLTEITGALSFLSVTEIVTLALVALQGIPARVRVVSLGQGKPRPRGCHLAYSFFQLNFLEAGRVVVNVRDFHFDSINLHLSLHYQLTRVVHQHLEADGAGRRVAAHLLPVQPLVHVQVPVLLIHREVLLLLAQPQLARRQLVRAEPQVPRQRPHERASGQLLGDGVAEPLGRRPAPHAQQQRGQQSDPPSACPALRCRSDLHSVLF
uniref:Uncharacterized protein n=1 Tax=Geospiza parvula TaxID=87175 RepID=A0A8U8AQF6_GEOPR